MCVLKVKVISLPYIFQVLNVFCFTRPRYQVRVYRTIGPLVLRYMYISLHRFSDFSSVSIKVCDVYTCSCIGFAICKR